MVFFQHLKALISRTFQVLEFLSKKKSRTSRRRRNFFYFDLTQCSVTKQCYSSYYIIINEQINVAFGPKTTRTRNIQKRNKKQKNDMFGR